MPCYDCEFVSDTERPLLTELEPEREVTLLLSGPSNDHEVAWWHIVLSLHYLPNRANGIDDSSAGSIGRKLLAVASDHHCHLDRVIAPAHRGAWDRAQ